MITIILSTNDEEIMNFPLQGLKIRNIPMVVRVINNAILLNSEYIFIILTSKNQKKIISLIKRIKILTTILMVLRRR